MFYERDDPMWAKTAVESYHLDRTNKFYSTTKEKGFHSCKIESRVSRCPRKRNTTLLAAKGKDELTAVSAPISIEALDALIKKVEEQRAHLIPRLIDDDGFQTPDKRHTAKKIGKKNPSLPPTTSQTSNTAQAPPHLLNRVILRLRTRVLVKAILRLLAPQNRIPPIFVNPPDNWCTLISTARQLAPTLISKLNGKFLRITVQSDDEYRKLAQFLRGVEYKSFMLKSDRTLKLLIRGLPTSTKVEEIRVEIEREGFQIHKISRLQKYKTKAPMPLIYLQLVNDAKADTISVY
ncbi:RNA-directed DNA polymerase from mobile element jockey [Trichonephila clavipes]|nr:RNA-directed DNA polymerase from mobile element jockey [Trichonephila clavipes]